MKKLWILQKKVKNNNKKVNYLFYLMLGNKVFFRLGYIIMFNNIYIIKINFNKLFKYLNLYKGIFEIRNDIYLKFF